jgi:hypothetical protein
MIYSRSVVDEELTTAYQNTGNSTEVSNNSTENSGSNTTSAFRERKVRTIK